MANFTKGKWRSNGMAIVADDKIADKIIALVGSSAPNEECAANAQLIAHAPEMYDWLKSILESPKVFADMPNLQNEVSELLYEIDDGDTEGVSDE